MDPFTGIYFHWVSKCFKFSVVFFSHFSGQSLLLMISFNVCFYLTLSKVVHYQGALENELFGVGECGGNTRNKTKIKKKKKSVFRLLFLSFRKGEFAWSRWCVRMCIRAVLVTFSENKYSEETVTVTNFSVICVCVFKSIDAFHIQQCSNLPTEIRWDSSDYIYITLLRR